MIFRFIGFLIFLDSFAIGKAAVERALQLAAGHGSGLRRLGQVAPIGPDYDRWMQYRERIVQELVKGNLHR